MAIKTKNKPRTHKLTLGASGQFASRKPFISALTHGVFRVRGKGSVLAASLLILSAVLIIALSISAVLVKEIKISIGSRKSIHAFQIATAGVEEFASRIIKGTSTPPVAYTVGEIAMLNECSDTTKLLSKDNFTIELRDKNERKINCDNDAGSGCPMSIYYISSLISVGKDPSGQQQRALRAIINDRHAKLLIHADGDNDSVDFSDSSYDPKAITPKEDTKISDTEAKFGGYDDIGNCKKTSAYFDGGANGNIDYLEVADSDDWNFSDNDFIIQAWI